MVCSENRTSVLGPKTRFCRVLSAMQRAWPCQLELVTSWRWYDQEGICLYKCWTTCMTSIPWLFYKDSNIFKVFLLLLFFFNLFWEREREKHQRGRDTSISCFLYVPQAPIKPTTEVYALTRNRPSGAWDSAPANWAAPAKAIGWFLYEPWLRLILSTLAY